MPLYEYQCQDCGVRFERRQHINDEPIKICPECEGEVHRLIQPVGVIFKGSGFYVTDNRAKSSTAKPGSTKRSKTPKESTSTSTDTGKSDSESSTKSE
jgi:putative FmdB family regulatory protein